MSRRATSSSIFSLRKLRDKSTSDSGESFSVPRNDALDVYSVDTEASPSKRLTALPYGPYNADRTGDRNGERSSDRSERTDASFSGIRDQLSLGSLPSTRLLAHSLQTVLYKLHEPRTALEDRRGTPPTSARVGSFINGTNPLLRKLTSVSMASRLSQGAVSLVGNSPSGNGSAGAEDSSASQIQRPSNPMDIERMFCELMDRRDFRSLPPAARQEMLGYSVDKKWMLVYQDALSERAKLSKKSLASPETYTRKLISKQITSEELENLWVSLRTELIDWVREFIFDFQGDVALLLYLIKLHDQIRTLNIEYASDVIFTKELNTLKCLRCMMNQKLGAERAKQDDALYVTAISGALLSPRLATRRIATETLAFLIVYYCSTEEHRGKYHRVLRALDTLSTRPYYEYNLEKDGKDRNVDSIRKITPENSGRFQLWLLIVTRTVDGRGKYQNSMVGASDELRATGTTSTQLENQLFEYCLLMMLLVNTIVQYGADFRARMQLRVQFTGAGLEALMEKFEAMGYELLSKQCSKYADMADADDTEWRAAEQVGVNVDFNNPVDLVASLWSNVQNSDAEGIFVSTMQQLFLHHMEHKDEPNDRIRSLRLLDGLIRNVAGAHSSTELAIGVAINKLFQGLTTDDMYRQAVAEVRTLKKIAAEATAERDEMLRQLTLGLEGLITILNNEVKEQEIVLRRTRQLHEEAQEELEQLKRKYLMEKQEQEMEMRELLIMLNSGDVQARRNGMKTTFSVQTSNAQLVQKLQKQIARKKKEVRVDNQQLKSQIEPSSRLRALREQMNDIEVLARELEMTDFAESFPERGEGEEGERQVEELEGDEEVDEEEGQDASIRDIQIEEVKVGKPRAMRNDDLEMLAKLRLQLASLQTESNDIMKYNNSKLFAKQRVLAMDRLRELENNFRNFNIDFDYLEQDAALVAQLVDANVKARLQEEMEEIARLKEDLKQQLANSSSSSSLCTSKRTSLGSPIKETTISGPSSKNNALDRLESRYGQGMLETEDTGTGSDFSNGQIKVDRQKSLDPKFLTELSSKVSKTQPICDMKENNKELELGSKVEAVPKPNVAPPPPPLPPLLLPTLVGPPPPPLPPLLGGVATPTAGAPPPPPLPPLLSGVPLLASSETPPTPPFPLAKPPPSSPAIPAATTPTAFDRYPRPKKKLKQLHWEKMDPVESNLLSFWNTAKPQTVVHQLRDKGVLEEIDVIFAAKEIRNLAPKKKADVDRIAFLARDTAQQFGINLHFFNGLTDAEVVAKVLRCDCEVIQNTSVLEFLAKDEIVETPNSLALNLQPYSTDYASGDLSKPEKDPAELQRPDRLYLELIYNLQHYWKSRMRALRTMSSYVRDYDDLVYKLREIDTAVAIIKESEPLRRVFEIILAVGNYMNDTAKQAQGFKLNSLLRLAFVKDDKNSMSFLHYVEKIVRLNFPEYLEFLEQLGKCLQAAKYSIEVITNDCRDYLQAIRNVQSLIDGGNLSDVTKFHPQDRVLKVVTPMLPKAKKKAELLQDQARYTLKELEKLMVFFGEDYLDSFVKNLFFSKFTNFAADFKKAQRENLLREEELKVYEQRKKLMETARLTQQKQESADEPENVMDLLLEKLKAAGPERGEPTLARKRILMKKHLMNSKLESNNSAGDKDVGLRARSLLQELRSNGQDSPDIQDTQNKTEANREKHDVEETEKEEKEGEKKDNDEDEDTLVKEEKEKEVEDEVCLDS